MPLINVCLTAFFSIYCNAQYTRKSIHDICLYFIHPQFETTKFYTWKFVNSTKLFLLCFNLKILHLAKKLHNQQLWWLWQISSVQECKNHTYGFAIVALAASTCTFNGSQVCPRSSRQWVRQCIGELVRCCISALVREMLDYMVRAGGTRLPLLIEKMSQQSLYIVYCIPYIIYLYIAAPGSRWLRRCNDKVLAVANWGPADQRVGIRVQITWSKLFWSAWSPCSLKQARKRRGMQWFPPAPTLSLFFLDIPDSPVMSRCLDRTLLLQPKLQSYTKHRFLFRKIYVYG